MKEKQKSSNEIHWVLVNPRIDPGDQANHKIRALLPSDLASHFATMYTGYNKWIWKLGVDAVPIQSLPPSEYSAALSALENLKSRVRSSLTNKQLAERILTYPNEEYVLGYKDASGQIDVIITGWGFTNRKAPETGPGIKAGPQVQSQRIRIGFAVDGTLVPNHAFTLVYGRATNTLQTGADGFYHFESPIPVNTRLLVTDSLTHREFPILVIRTREEFIFDITSQAQVSVSVRKDGEALPGASVTVYYDGKEQHLTCDSQGNCLCTQIFKEGQNIIVECEDQSLSQPAAFQGNHFDLYLTSSYPEVPEEEPVIMEEEPITTEEPDFTDSFVEPELPPVPPEEQAPEPTEYISAQLKVVDSNGIPVPGYPVSVMSTIGNWNGNMNERGYATLPPMPKGESFILADGNNPNNALRYTLSEERSEYVLTLLPLVKEKVHLRVIDKDKQTVRNTPVTLMHNGMAPVEGWLDENGDCLLDKSSFRMNEPIQLLVRSNARQFPPIFFSMTPEENDYLIEEEASTPSWMILLEILLALAVLVGLIFLVSPYIDGAYGISNLFH